jgi:hypothetical protein
MLRSAILWLRDRVADFIPSKFLLKDCLDKGFVTHLPKERHREPMVRLLFAGQGIPRIDQSTGTADQKTAEKFLKRRLEEVGADRIGAKRFSGPQQERVLVSAILYDLIAEYKLGGKRHIPREVGAPMQSQINRLREHFGAMRAMDVHDTLADCRER